MLIIKESYRAFDSLYETKEQAEKWLHDNGWLFKERVKQVWVLASVDELKSYPMELDNLEGYVFNSYEDAKKEKDDMEDLK